MYATKSLSKLTGNSHEVIVLWILAAGDTKLSDVVKTWMFDVSILGA